MKRLIRLGIILSKALSKARSTNGEDHCESKKISKQARFQRYGRAGGFCAIERFLERIALCHPEASAVASALRLSIGMAWSAAFVGGSQRSVARSFREATGGACRRSSRSEGRRVGEARRA